MRDPYISAAKWLASRLLWLLVIIAILVVARLYADESRLLFDLVRARLATTVTLLYWRLRDRPADDDYRRKSLQVERTASRFLAALGCLGRRRFDKEINKLLNR